MQHGKQGATHDQDQDHAGQIPPGLLAQHSRSNSIGWIGFFKRCWDDAVSGRLLMGYRKELPPGIGSGIGYFENAGSPSSSCPAEPDSDSALELASTTRGGGGQRGWWYPGTSIY